MKNRIVFVLGILTGLCIYMGIVAYSQNTPIITNMIIGCDGIENFYTGQGFKNDYYSVLKYGYNNNRIVGAVNMKNMTFQNVAPISPRDMLETNKSFDCETVSNAIYCLSRMYNKTCVLYMQREYSPIIKYGHQGVYCYDEKWGWEVVY